MSQYTDMISRLREEQKQKKGNTLSGLASIGKDIKKAKEDEEKSDKKPTESTSLKAKEVKSIVSERSDLKADDSIKEIEVEKAPSKLGLAFNSAKNAASDLGNKAVNATSGLAKIKPAYLGAADSAGQEIAAVVDPQGEGLGTIGSTALTGASIGSVVPGIGTAIGAVVGLGLGIIKAESNKKANQAKRELAAAGVMGEALQKQAEFRQLRLGQLSSPNRDLKF